LEPLHRGERVEMLTCLVDIHYAATFLRILCLLRVWVWALVHGLQRHPQLQYVDDRPC
jgi:hypothetical protein